MSGSRAKSGETERILTEISGKMTMFITKFDSMNDNFHELANTMKLQGELLKTIVEKGTIIPSNDVATQRVDTFPFLKEMNDTQTMMQADKQKENT